MSLLIRSAAKDKIFYLSASFVLMLLLSVNVYGQTPDCTGAVISASPTSINVLNSGGNQTVNVSAPSLCQWHPVSNSFFIHVPATNGIGNGTLTFGVDTNADLASRSGTVTLFLNTGSGTATISIFQAAGSGDFFINASPLSLTANEPSTSMFDIMVSKTGGFGGGVGLSVSGLGAGASASFSANPVFGSSPSTTVTMTITVASNATPGTYNIVVQGQNSGVVRSATVSFTINPTHVVNTEHVFYIGPELHVHELVWGGGQWFHNDLNAQWGGASAASGSKLTGFVFTPPGSSVGMDVFYLGADQHVHLLQWSNNTWIPSDLNTAAGGAPLAASGSALTGFVFTPTGSADQMHVFYFGADQHVHELLFANSWSHNDLTTEWVAHFPLPAVL